MPVNPRPTAFYTAAQVRRIDRHAIEDLGIPGFELMQRAAAAAFALLRQRWPAARRLALLAGSGNNGGDAFLLGRDALQAGFDVAAIALPVAPGGDAVRARLAFVAAGGRVVDAAADTPIPPADVCVDGLFGTGLSRPVEGVAAALIERLSAAACPVLALDVPSGLDADTGMRLGPRGASRGDDQFHRLEARPVHRRRGRLLRGIDLGVAGRSGCRVRAGARRRRTARRRASPTLLTPRRSNANKGQYGHVLAIGGDRGMGGAIQLAGEAALRIGAGLVSVATLGDNVAALNAAARS